MSEIELKNYLVGGWRLLSWRIEYSDGRISYPFGEEAIGQLLYSADGAMSATVSAAKRPTLSDKNVRHVPETEQADAFRSYFHYAGGWRIDGHNVVHEVELGLNSGFPGTNQVRRVEIITAEQMTLSAQEDLPNDQSRRHALTWQRNK
jgi:hypothetical protein